jgi:putative alpha-1,2-mannosidase
MYDESLGLSKADRLWRDALETAAASKSTAVAEDLAGYFVSIGNKDAFAAILYVCFELVRPDFVEEMVSYASRCGTCIRSGDLQLTHRHGALVWATMPSLMCFNNNGTSAPRSVD